MTIIKAKEERVKMREGRGSKSLRAKKRSNFLYIEDKNDLSEIQKITALGTKEAYKQAISMAQVIAVKAGKLVRIEKGITVEVLKEISVRTVQKGETFLISAHK